jgi:putative transposase
MADELRIGLEELLSKARIEGDAGFLKEGVRVLSQALMELEVEEHIGAGRHEGSPERKGQRNGYRGRTWDTRVGTVALSVSRVRDGSYFPSLLEPRRKAERALAAVVQEAYVHGVSTRKVDDLVRALGMSGVSKSRVSELCEELDEEVSRFRSCPLEGPYPYVWLDATYLKARQDGRVSSTSVVIAVGVNGDTGEREVLGLDVGPSEDGAFWVSFLRSLVRRGLEGVRLVTSDAHRGLKAAIEPVLVGASWQRCRVHFMRNALSLVPRAAQPDAVSAREQWRRVTEGFRSRFPRLAELMDEAEEDVVAYTSLPTEHWQRS